MYAPNSPMLPANCDDACISQHRIARLSLLIEGGVTTSDGGGSEYYVEMSVGLPNPQPVYLFLDSGSDFPWFQCQPCNPCYPQPLPIFDGAASGSHQVLGQGDVYCNLLQASTITTGSCSYSIQYGDGTTSTGQASRDTFLFDDVGVESISFGCGTSNSVPATGLRSSGVLGLAAGQRGLSLPEQLGNWYGTTGYSFSYCLQEMWSEPRTGFLILGTASQPAPSHYGGYTALTAFTASGGSNCKEWYVNIDHILIEGVRLAIDDSLLRLDTNTGNGGTLIDSGTPFSLLHINIYQPFRDAWRAAIQAYATSLPGPSPGPFGLDTCYDFPDDNVHLPAVYFAFPETSLFTPRSSNIFFYAGDAGQRRICWPYLVKPPSARYGLLMGAISHQNVQMIYNVEGGQLGWIYDEC